MLDPEAHPFAGQATATLFGAGARTDLRNARGLTAEAPWVLAASGLGSWRSRVEGFMWEFTFGFWACGLRFKGSGV